MSEQRFADLAGFAPPGSANETQRGAILFLRTGQSATIQGEAGHPLIDRTVILLVGPLDYIGIIFDTLEFNQDWDPL